MRKRVGCFTVNMPAAESSQPPYVLQPDGQRVRTSDRRDYSVTPPEDTMLDLIRADGGTVYAVGKIHDIFNGKGITKSVHTVSNDDGVTKTIEAYKAGFSGADIHKSGGF